MYNIKIFYVKYKLPLEVHEDDLHPTIILLNFLNNVEFLPAHWSKNNVVYRQIPPGDYSP